MGSIVILALVVAFTQPWKSAESPAPEQAVVLDAVATPTVVPTATPVPPTATPVPTATPIPDPPQWAELDAAIARNAEPEELLWIFAQDPQAVDQRGRNTFAGLQDAMDEQWPERLRAADQLVQEDRFVEAQVAFDELAAWFPDRSDFAARAVAAEEWQTQIEVGEPWTEPVLHLFIHSLIIRPELAFDGDYQDTGYREYMITRLEFTRMLDQMLDRDFVLVDIRDLYDAGEDGSVTQQYPLVPPGKTPFVFSIDDVSYYEYMEGNGFAERLEIDADLNVATVVIQDDGSELVTLDGDAMPILDQFVLDNPEFSLGGAKGILAVTGYEGVFGWDFSRDQRDHPDYERNQTAAAEISERLRETGWSFADPTSTSRRSVTGWTRRTRALTT